jgi:hypothetical protein
MAASAKVHIRSNDLPSQRLPAGKELKWSVVLFVKVQRVAATRRNSKFSRDLAGEDSNLKASAREGQSGKFQDEHATACIRWIRKLGSDREGDLR